MTTAQKQPGASSAIPAFDVSEIANRATAQVFRRGQQLFESDSILEPVRQGSFLRAQCEGSEYEPYSINLVLTADGISHAGCSCAYEWEGMCKHCVALALCWLHHPERFREIAPLDQLLEGLDRDALQRLVEQFIASEPSLLPLVEAATLVASNALDAERPGLGADELSAYRTRVQTVLRKLARMGYHDDDSEARRFIDREQQLLRAAASGFAVAGAQLKAAAYDAILLEELILNYDDIAVFDDIGDLSAVAEECSTTIARALPEADDSQRRQWLQLLLRAEVHSHVEGGLELPAPALKTVLECAPEDWPPLEAYIHKRLVDSESRNKDGLTGLIRERLRFEGRADEIAALIRAHGSPQQRTWLLLEEGDVAGAMAMARQHFNDSLGELLAFADALVEAGHADQAVALIEPRAEALPGAAGHHHASWLAEHFIRTNEWDAAWRWQLVLCEQTLSEQYWEQLRFISERLDDWPRRRAGFEASLRENKRGTALMRIALWENDAAQALQLMEQLPESETQPFAEPVALLAEKQYPEAALKIYHDMAARAIERRSRSAYARAIQILRRAKTLHQRTGTLSDWDETLTSLQEKYKTLRAFHEELRNARL